MWPGIALGALVTNLGIGAPPAVACGIALGNTLEALAGAWAMRRLTGGYPSFSRVRDVLVLIGLAAVASTGISATIGVASLRLGGIVPGADALETWRAWWVGDAMGDLVVVPLLLGMAARGDGPRETSARPRVPETLALGVLLLATNLFVFGMREDRDSSMLREAYLVFPLLVWAGLRFGARGAAWVNFVVSAVAITGTAAGRGPFQMASLSQSLLHLQAFMLIVAATTLILGSVSDERRHAIGLRDSLISLASHELRTPLTSLQLRVQLLARNARAPTLSKERFSRDAAGAEEQVKRMARLVDDLLDISRIMSGRMRLDVEDVDLGGFVREVVDRCPEPQRDLVGVRVEGEPIVGRWDRMRIDQIVSNLLSNALKYGENNPIEISVGRDADRARLDRARPRRGHRGGGPAEDLRALRASGCAPHRGLRPGPVDRPAGRRRAGRDDRRREPPRVRLGVHRRAPPRADPRRSRASHGELSPPRRQGLRSSARREERRNRKIRKIKRF